MDLTEAEQRFFWWDDDDLRALADVARRIGADAADLLLVLYCESGLRADAVARNAQGFPVAVGLNQITSVAARSMGIGEAERIAMVGRPIREQLPYVERYFLALPWRQAGHRFPTAAILYQANAAPGTLGRGTDPSLVLYRQGDGMYEGNAQLDFTHKGTVTLGDLAHVLEKNSKHSLYQAALTRLQHVTSSASGPTIFQGDVTPTSALGPILLGSAAAVFVGFLFTRGRG